MDADAVVAGGSNVQARSQIEANASNQFLTFLVRLRAGHYTAYVVSGFSRTVAITACVVRAWRLVTSLPDAPCSARRAILSAERNSRPWRWHPSHAGRSTLQAHRAMAAKPPSPALPSNACQLPRFRKSNSDAAA